MSRSYSLPSLLVEMIEGLARSGHFSSRSDVVKEALRFFLDQKPQLRQAAVVEMYRLGRVSLTKGAEIMDVPPDQFQEILRDQNIPLIDTVEWETIE